MKDLPPGAGPADRTLGIEPGSETVVRLYHFEHAGHLFKDEDFAYTIAVALKRREHGRFEIPSEAASVVFFCDNWGRGFRACEARATGGWLRVAEADQGGLSGEFDVTLEGVKERPDGTREKAVLSLQGRFKAAP